MTDPIARAFALLRIVTRNSSHKWVGSYEFDPKLPKSWHYVILYNEDRDDKLYVYGNGNRKRT